MSGHANTVRTMTTAEAAFHLGVSERTVRRWVSKGKLRGELVDGTLLVSLTSAGADSDADICGHEDSHADSSGQSATADAVTRGHVELEAVLALSDRLQDSMALVERLQRENVELAGRVGFLQAQVLVRDQRILALSAPADPMVEEEPERPQAAWWKRLLGLEPA